MVLVLRQCVGGRCESPSVATSPLFVNAHAMALRTTVERPRIERTQTYAVSKYLLIVVRHFAVLSHLHTRIIIDV